MDFEIKKLCAHCSMLIPPSKSPAGFNQRHCSNLALLETSSHDCGLCSVFLDQWSLTAVQERLPDANEDNYDQMLLEVRILETQAPGETLVWGFLSVGFFVQDHALIYENEITLTTFASNSNRSYQLKPKASTTSIESRLAEVRSWLGECKDSHPHCNDQIKQLPKRLIDVGQADISPDLVTCTELEGKPARYATLSYYWGASAFTTRKSTLISSAHELPYEELPRIHREAITVARCLGFTYLWIDALCIVQDDNTEWEQEASRMQDIYAGSDLTIAATDSPDGSSGCFLILHLTVQCMPMFSLRRMHLRVKNTLSSSISEI
ncbi:hypothetical protein IFR04_005630 [Cadophora malorum]|uniref:Heterokaryon incompatibility domain-containing protein n=1 Tax=Cadophora malorum TaxID=108018 RepID=A0A8H7TGL4_9HELO|nr:hypothetical protein IFR04_005630 [Cadophora malorum]